MRVLPSPDLSLRSDRLDLESYRGQASRKARPRYLLKYARATVAHLRAIEPKYHTLIRTAIEEQLGFEPDRETRNRKRVGQPNSIDAEWGIRFGPDNRFRVFCTVDPEEREVAILAIGVKDRNRLFIGGEEEEL